MKVKVMQFLIAFVVGWIMAHNFWYLEASFGAERTFWPNKAGTYVRQSSMCLCRSQNLHACLPCIDTNVVATQEKVSNSYYRSYLYKPSSFKDVTLFRWSYYRDDFVYDLINYEPRIGLNGVRWAEIQKAKSHAKEILKISGISDAELRHVDLYEKYDPFAGKFYVANFVEVSDANDTKQEIVILNRPFVAGPPKLVDIKLATRETQIAIVSTVFQAKTRLESFLERFKLNVLKRDLSAFDSLRMIFVLFDTDRQINGTIGVISRFREENGNKLIDFYVIKGGFSRNGGLHHGTIQCHDDEIVVYMDIDMLITIDFLNRIKRNVVKNETVVFPVAFSQFDPDVRNYASEVLPHLRSRDQRAINKQSGFWLDYAFGISAMYKSDYVKIGGFISNRTGWGGEDVDFFEKVLADPDLTVMSAVDPDLIHLFHSRDCNAGLPSDQFQMCLGAWAETIGSQMELATLLLREHRNVLKKGSKLI